MKLRETIKNMIKSIDKAKNNLDMVEKENNKVKETTQTVTELCARLGVK